ncbi:dUTP diphosphatase [Myxococcota bacterium]|nr:dUTP diphosphatase [Myxococcota bacterium]MBU1429015.1 dUTP diphosphatase [Myxococcota bacterium]MBU1898429.1 dUTP diphosphatase [Myxococcota bacterium]
MRIRRYPSAEAPSPLPRPRYMTAGAAGLDMAAAVRVPLEIPPGGRASVPLGFSVEIPAGHEGQLRARSGRALREGLTTLNGVGTIDPDYRGELHVLLINLGDAPVTIERGERVAQLVISPITRLKIEEVLGLSETPRGDGGLGHTGD